MRAWEEKAEKVWKSWPAAVLLCGTAAASAMWAWYTLPAPGVSIAIQGINCVGIPTLASMRCNIT